MLYSILADTLEKIESTTKRLEMTDYLVALFKKTPKEVIDKVVHLTLGEIYPPFIGIELGIAEKLALKAIAIASGRSENETSELYKQTGDIGVVAEKLLKKKIQATLFFQPLTVERVYETFDKIARATGEGAQDLKIRLLASLLNDAKPKEARYIARMAVGRLRIGIADMTILDALAILYGGSKELRDKIERAYNLSSDIGYVAKTLAEGGIESIHNFRIVIGKPIRPQLAERLESLDEILEKLKGKAAVEYKYDGLRLQAHISKKENKVYLFSRRLENITNQFPDIAEALKEAVLVDEAIVDGECVPVDPYTGDMLPFQVVAHRRGRKYDIEKMVEEIPVVLFLFDALYVSGKDYTIKPYPERRKILSEIVRETDRVKISSQLISGNKEEIERFFEQAIQEGCEGLVLKSISSDSIYEAGKRGYIWIKWKRSYRSDMTDTVDLVIVGAFAGKGRRAGSYGALLMAAYNPEKDVFETVCKLGSGFTDEDLAKLPEILKPYILPRKHARVESIMEPDYWISPSIVLEVIGDEITLSPLHTCGFGSIRKGSGLAIRFPRLVRFRNDKSPEDATTVQEIINMYKKQLKTIREN